MTRRGRRVIATFVLVASGVASCGGGVSEGGPVTSSPGQREGAVPSIASTTLTTFPAQAIAATEPGAGELVTPLCPDYAGCGVGFVLNGRSYDLGCSAVRESTLTAEVIGTGTLEGQSVTVNVIDGVDPDVLVAVSLPGGWCSDDPDTEVHTDWTAAHGARGGQLDALCDVGALSASQRLANDCHLGTDLLTCGVGPGFPSWVLDDLTAFPETSEHFGADVEALVGTADPQDAAGWRVILDEEAPDGNLVQLLLRKHPATGQLEFLVDGGVDISDAPRPCAPEPIG